MELRCVRDRRRFEAWGSWRRGVVDGFRRGIGGVMEGPTMGRGGMRAPRKEESAAGRRGGEGLAAGRRRRNKPSEGI